MVKPTPYMGSASIVTRAASIRICIRPGSVRSWETKTGECFVPVLAQTRRDYERERGG